ncbi:MAG TPA: indole-3-glycerol phosphate synthase TrpC, partial [Terriglobia bacterium]|nr:indole-3-glycerol phosphate synthase TrpC [Terriglobia bacterium]
MNPASSQGDILERIVRAKRVELERFRVRVPQAVLEKRLSPRPAGRFRNALIERRPGAAELAVIAEAKKASPSRGILRQNYDPVGIAQGYERAGARALSVLTEADFFQGSLDHLRQVKAAVSLPVLRKDFTLDEYHLYEAADAGADAILLIVAILEPPVLARLLRSARELALDALVEVHTAEELMIAIDSGAEIIGVNNRNLKTFEVSLNTSLQLIDKIPDECIAISESGLRSRAELEGLQAAGFDAFLIGERFMAEPDPGAALQSLLQAKAAR